MSETVLYRLDGNIAVLTLNRPESLNAMNPELLDTLVTRAQQAADDPEVRCLVITGAGRAFCAGGDVKGMASGAFAAGGSDLRQQMEVSRLLYEMPKPTVAAVNGAAAGAGLSVALAADLRLASEQARFGTAFARVGLSGDFGGTWLLQRLVGPSKAKELYFLADLTGADEAFRLGMVNRVVPHDTLMEETMALARRLAAGPTAAYSRMKANFVFGATSTFAETLTKEAENHTASSLTADHRDAARAFVEKREPTFVGR